MPNVSRAKCRAKTKAGNSYADLVTANVVAARANHRRGPFKTQRNPVQPFLCQLCGRWHVGKGRLTRQWEAENDRREGEG